MDVTINVKVWQLTSFHSGKMIPYVVNTVIGKIKGEGVIN